MDNRVMMITTTQRQIERAAEKEVDAAQAVKDAVEVEMGMVHIFWGPDSAVYRAALVNCDRSRSTFAAAIDNLERTAHDDPDT